MRLKGKQQDQNDHGQGHDEFVESRLGDVDAFDRRQHRERRRDDRIAIEERSADDAKERDSRGRLADPADRTRRQRHQRERATLAVIVGPQ